MSDLTSLSLTQTLSALDKNEFSEAELNKAYLDRIKKLNPELNAFLYVNDSVIGVPAAIKDVISTKGLPTTAGSKILEGYIPPYNAVVVDKLLSKNIGIIGKTNCDEFAMGSSGENSAYGVTKNPWDLTKVPGGSSSGSAVVVASDLATFALGTDTGGSVRQPASLCGVVGLRPSYGLLSRFGLISMASSLDTPGIFGKTVEDVKSILSWISGGESLDSNCWEKEYIPSQPLENLNNLKLGLPEKYFTQGLDPKVKELIMTAAQKLESLGAKLIEVDLPRTEYAIATYYIIMASEVSSNLARFDGIRFGQNRDKFGDEPKRRIMLGTYSLSSGYYDDYFIKAAKVRKLISEDFRKAFTKCDLILSPVSPTPAWNIGEKTSDPLAMYLSDVYTIPSNLAGLPGISIPAGFSDGLPVGLQLIGKYLEDGLILDVAEAYQNNTDWRKEKPKLAVK